jgi:hypothetical protein
LRNRFARSSGRQRGTSLTTSVMISSRHTNHHDWTHRLV